jgi:hypothetical protein
MLMLFISGLAELEVLFWVLILRFLQQQCIVLVTKKVA